MSIKVMENPRHYIGLSSDTKPGCPGEGITLYEVNTGVQWQSHDGVWYEDLRLIYALSQALNGGK